MLGPFTQGPHWRLTPDPLGESRDGFLAQFSPAFLIGLGQASFEHFSGSYGEDFIIKADPIGR